MRVLIVEDDPRTAEYLKAGLKQEGFAVECAADGGEGCHMAMHDTFDAIVMDIMLPRMDGLAVVRRLRQLLIETPVLVLSAKGAVDERIAGLRAGGDDYLAKPFSFAELVARLETLVRRGAKLQDTSALVKAGITVDKTRHSVHIAGREVVLQPREYRLLVYLMENAGRVLSKAMILDRVWGINFDPQTNVVEARISKLRKRLADHGAGELILTVRGLGYRFDETTG
ncbi:MAG: response regulator transcription factor [Vicinamibacterales bacterium]